MSLSGPCNQFLYHVVRPHRDVDRVGAGLLRERQLRRLRDRALPVREPVENLAQKVLHRSRPPEQV